MMASTPTYEKGILYDISIIDFRPDPNRCSKRRRPCSAS